MLSHTADGISAILTVGRYYFIAHENYENTDHKHIQMVQVCDSGILFRVIVLSSDKQSYAHPDY